VSPAAEVAPRALDATLDACFGRGRWRLEAEGDLVRGEGQGPAGPVALLGTTNHAFIGADLALALAERVLEVVERHPGRAILQLVDNSGQRLARRDEMLGNVAFLAHLASCLALARARGHRVLALVTARALSGGFMATGMAADACFAMAGAELRVMRLDAMARITRLPQARLEALAATDPVFRPEADAFWRLGALDGIWAPDEAREALAAALAAPPCPDRRDSLGEVRGGRRMAAAVARRVATWPAGEPGA
jgi:malonate decarboxylase gamma subunit